MTTVQGELPAITGPEPQAIAPVAGRDAFSRDWDAVRADPDLQFSPIQMPERPPPPDWWLRFLEWLGEVMAPVAGMFVASWPVLKWVLLALLVAGICYMFYRLIGPAGATWSKRRRRPAGEEWTPGEAQALALLDDADRLAAEGRFDEATHLLLVRSVGQISEARPDLVEPSSTAREIAAEPQLPEAARTAFAVIAERVERSLFALRALSSEDWQAARSAYAEFALARPGTA